MWARLRQKKKIGSRVLSNGDRKGGRDFASFVLWNVPFIDLRELNKCGRDFASLLFCFVLFCFVLFCFVLFCFVLVA